MVSGDTPHLFFCAREVAGTKCVENRKENGMMADVQVFGFNVDKKKMDRDIQTIKNLLKESGAWTGGRVPYPECHFLGEAYEEWENRCTKFLAMFSIKVPEGGMKAARAAFIASELKRLIVEIPQNVYKFHYTPLTDRIKMGFY